jgi:hypothetical protein
MTISLLIAPHGAVGAKRVMPAVSSLAIPKQAKSGRSVQKTAPRMARGLQLHQLARSSGFVRPSAISSTRRVLRRILDDARHAPPDGEPAYPQRKILSKVRRTRKRAARRPGHHKAVCGSREPRAALFQARGGLMLYFVIKSAVSGLIVAMIAEIARRSPPFSALVASLPLISIMAVIWLWWDTGDDVRIASQLQTTFWYVLPSLPMFLLVPVLLRSGAGFWPALGAGCLLTFLLYLVTAWVLARFGVEM